MSREAGRVRRAVAALCIALLVSGFVHAREPYGAGHGQAYSTACTATAGAPLDACHDEADWAHGVSCSGISGCSVFALAPDAGTATPAKSSPAAMSPRSAPYGVTAAPRIRPPKISA